MRILKDHGLVIDGHDIRRADVLAQASEFLAEHGMNIHDIEERLIDRPGLIARAWWDDELGFVQEHHDGQPVTVVNVDVPE